MTPSTSFAYPPPTDPQKQDQALAHFREEYLGLSPGDRRSLREWLYRLEAIGGLGTCLRLGVEVVFSVPRECEDGPRVAIAPIELRRAMEVWDHRTEVASVG